jgi:hypothetical protein
VRLLWAEIPASRDHLAWPSLSLVRGRVCGSYTYRASRGVPQSTPSLDEGGGERERDGFDRPIARRHFFLPAAAGDWPFLPQLAERNGDVRLVDRNHLSLSLLLLHPTTTTNTATYKAQ